MHYCTLSLSDIWVALLKEIFDNKIYDKYQVYSQVSFAEAGFSFGEEIFLDIVHAHIETGVGMIRADYLRIRKRNSIISSKYLSAPIPRKQIWPQHVSWEHQRGLFHTHGRSTCPSCPFRPPPCAATMKENSTKNCWNDKKRLTAQNILSEHHNTRLFLKKRGNKLTKLRWHASRVHFISSKKCATDQQTNLPTYLHLTWVGARDTCVSKN